MDTCEPLLAGLLLAGAPGPDGQTYNFTLSARKGGRSATVYTSVAVVAATKGGAARILLSI